MYSKVDLNLFHPQIADPDLLSTVADADILIFVTPDAFIIPLCRQMKPALKRGVIGISLIKSFATLPNGDIGLLSNEIQHTLGIAEVAVLMGANLAHEVAEGHFCETTIGVRTALSGKILKHLFQTDNFRVTYVQDVFTVEGCGAIKVPGMGWDGMGWDGMGWDGMGWDGMQCITLTKSFPFSSFIFSAEHHRLRRRLRRRPRPRRQHQGGGDASRPGRDDPLLSDVLSQKLPL